MKPWMLLPHFKQLKLFKHKFLGSRGQSIIEFVLLLSVIFSISYGFVYIVNLNLARYWEYSANLVVTDRPGEKVIRLP